MPLSPGDLVDRYRIIARLGAGGMGEVYRAHDTRLQRDIALKILHTDPSAGSGSGPVSEGATRLLREARSVAALEHPNVITIHDVGEIAQPEELRGMPYIAMELIKGKSLRDHASGPPPTLEERVAWLAGAARGLAAAHKAGIVHRDVKPENVMVRDDGVVKVLDFGIAKRSYPSTAVDPTSSTEAQLLPQLSTKGVVIGTPYYMAPEQMRNDPLDGRADQFSWGVVAYELLAGKPPWRMGGDALQLVSEILSHTPPPPSSLNPEIPAYLDAVVMRTLTKSRDERFATMSQVVDALALPGMPSFRSLPPPTNPFARTESSAPVVPSMPVPGALTPHSGPASLPIAPPSAAPGAPSVARWLRIGSILAVAGALGVAAIEYRHREAPGRAVSAAGAPAAGAEPGATSNVAAAASAYRAAMMAMRDADFARATRELEEALRADPDFAAAHLRYFLTTIRPNDVARAHLQQATRLRTTLDAHDQILVNAFGAMATAPGDLVETEKRLAEAARQFPQDEDFAIQLCRTRQALALPSAIETCRLASALSPGAATPLRSLALAEVQGGDVRGALASFDACLRASPLATSCLTLLYQLQSFEGDCDGALASAKRLVSADPESPDAYDALAEALLGSGQSLDSVRAAIDSKLARLPPPDALLAKREDEARLAIRTGDFVHAREALRAWDDAVSGSRAEEDHFPVTENRVLLAIEEGRTSDAKALATAYLSHRAAWSTTNGYDYSIVLDGMLYRVGAITREDFARRRATWLAWRKAQPNTDRLAFGWIFAYAAPASNAEDAREALGALPEYLPLPNPLYRAPDLEFPIGEVYRLAGRDSEALPYLARAAKACVGMEAPFEPTWASVALGESLEKLGDVRGACDSYAVVLSRWKAAGSSVSARQAERRLRALGCSH